MRQTRRNLTIEYLDLNFASKRNLCKNSVFYENMNTAAFILFGKVFIFSHFCSFPFRKCIPLPSLSDIDILRDSVPDLKISIRSVTFDTFNWLRRNFVWPEEGGGGLATDWFFTAANFALQFFWGKFLRESVWRKLSNAEMVNLRELQVDDISAKFTAESAKKYIPVR